VYNKASEQRISFASDASAEAVHVTWSNTHPQCNDIYLNLLVVHT